MVQPDAGARSGCVVIVTVDAPSRVMDVLIAHARVGIRRFGECPGFIDGALHVSEDRERLVQYLRWASTAQYEACRDDPRWEVLPTATAFMALVSSGEATLDARVYEVVEASS